jgi:hypothetical protein
MSWENEMRFAKPLSIASGLLVLALSTVATGARAHDDDHGWKKKHYYYRSPVYVVRERPVYYYSEPRVVYAPPPVAYYPAYPVGPPSLNINIPLR